MSNRSYVRYESSLIEAEKYLLKAGYSPSAKQSSTTGFNYTKKDKVATVIRSGERFKLTIITVVSSSDINS